MDSLEGELHSSSHPCTTYAHVPKLPQFFILEETQKRNDKNGINPMLSPGAEATAAIQGFLFPIAPTLQVVVSLALRPDLGPGNPKP